MAADPQFKNYELVSVIIDMHGFPGSNNLSKLYQMPLLGKKMNIIVTSCFGGGVFNHIKQNIEDANCRDLQWLENKTIITLSNDTPTLQFFTSYVLENFDVKNPIKSISTAYYRTPDKQRSELMVIDQQIYQENQEPKNLLDRAIELGNENDPINTKNVQSSAEEKQNNVLFQFNKILESYKSAILKAIETSDIEDLSSLLEVNKYHTNLDILNAAIATEDANVLDIVIKHYSDKIDDNILSAAIETRNANVVDIVLQKFSGKINYYHLAIAYNQNDKDSDAIFKTILTKIENLVDLHLGWLINMGNLELLQIAIPKLQEGICAMEVLKSFTFNNPELFEFILSKYKLNVQDPQFALLKAFALEHYREVLDSKGGNNSLFNFCIALKTYQKNNPSIIQDIAHSEGGMVETHLADNDHSVINTESTLIGANPSSLE